MRHVRIWMAPKFSGSGLPNYAHGYYKMHYYTDHYAAKSTVDDHDAYNLFSETDCAVYRVHAARVLNFTYCRLYHLFTGHYSTHHAYTHICAIRRAITLVQVLLSIPVRRCCDRVCLCVCLFVGSGCRKQICRQNLHPTKSKMAADATLISQAER